MREAAFATNHVTVYLGHVLDVLREMPADSIDCVVTSPPYWGLRAYQTPAQVWGGDPACEHVWGDPQSGRVTGGGDRPADNKARAGFGPAFDSPSVRHTCSKCGAWQGELGLEPTPSMYVEHIVQVFREVRRVLRKHGTLWLNLGDTFAARPGQGAAMDTMQVDRKKKIARGAGRWGGGQKWADGLKPKDLVGIPWRVAFALQEDGWYLRRDIVWAKPNPMPESVVDRPSSSHEYVFLLAKSKSYYYDGDAIAEPLAGTAHARGNGVNPKAQANEPGSRQNESWSAAVKDLLATPADPASESWLSRVPSGWDTGPGNHHGLNRRYKRDDSTRDDAKRAARAVAPPPEKGWASDHVLEVGRNSRSVWSIATQPYPDAHFATFPEELPRRAIKAGTSERGSCAECGKPWKREVQRGNSEHHCRPGCNHDPEQRTWATEGWGGYGHPERQRSGDAPDGTKTSERRGSWESASTVPYGGFYPTATLTGRWTASCAHDGAPVPSVVLDPFAGSGTTLMVARDAGRRSIGIELQPEDLRLIVKRCQQEALAL